MLRTVSFQPDWVARPSDALEEALLARNYTAEQFSSDHDIDFKTLVLALNGATDIDEYQLECLERVVGVSSKFWVARRSQYLATVRSKINQGAVDFSELLKCIPFASLNRLGWISCGKDISSRTSSVLDFFGVSDLEEYNTKYKNQISAVAFRESFAFSSNPFSVVAWLRKAEIEATNVNCSIWDRNRFDTQLSEVKALTRIKDPRDFLPKLKRICASCGVALVIVEAPDGCRASGATKFLSPHKAMIVLSLRYKSDDQFWFTFFHEAGHLLLHSEDALFLEDNSDVTADEESEANEFAKNRLIDQKQWHSITVTSLKYKDVIRHAYVLGISPGILVGQLQHAGRLPHNKMNFLKRRYAWGNDGVPQLIP